MCIKRNQLAAMLAIIFCLFALSLRAQDGHYLLRPNILDMEAQKHSLGSKWDQFKKGHIEAIALILEMYPEHEIYFLSRDADLFFDQAKIVLKNNPERSKRIHLLNISRKSVRAQHVKKYLAQEGLSLETLEQGKKFLFVDTALRGTIPRVISSYYPHRYSSQIQSHFVIADNGDYPSTRSFLMYVQNRAGQMKLDDLFDTIYSDYEKSVPSYNSQTSHGFTELDGKWVPIAEKINQPNPNAVAHMQDLLYFNETVEGRELYQNRSQLWRELQQFLQEGQRKKLIKKLKSLLANNKPYAEAIVRDFISAIRQNNLYISLNDLGLPVLEDEDIKKLPPEWKHLLHNPRASIQKLLAEKDLTTLENMMNTIKDSGFKRMLAETVGAYSDEDFNKRVTQLVLKIKDLEYLGYFASYVLPQPYTKEWGDLVGEFIDIAKEQNDKEILFELADYAFPTLHAREWQDNVKKFISATVQLRAASSLGLLAQYGFSAHATQWRGLRKNLLDAAATLGQTRLLNAIHEHVLQQDQSQEGRALRRLIEDFYADRDWQKLRRKISRALKDRLSIHEFVRYSLEDDSFKVGTAIQTDQLGEVYYQKRLFKNRKIAVYKVSSEQGDYVIKISQRESKDMLEERPRVSGYQQYGVPHAAYLEGNRKYSIREFIDGEHGESFIKRWVENGEDINDPKIKKLYEFAKKMVDQRFYFGDISPANIIWSDQSQEWVVIDSTELEEFNDQKRIQKRIVRTFENKWYKRVLEQPLSRKCATLLQKLL